MPDNERTEMEVDVHVEERSGEEEGRRGFIHDESGARSMSRLVLFIAVALISAVYLWRVQQESTADIAAPPAWCLELAGEDFDRANTCADRALAHVEARAQRTTSLMGDWKEIVLYTVIAYAANVLGFALPKMRG